MGVVYLGRHRRLGRAVAIKELSGSLADDPEVRSRFLTEARTLAALDHPHVVPVYDYVEAGGRCLLIMEALSGGTVWSVFTSSGLTQSKSVALVLAACAGVHHAHHHGVLHRDLKPENLLFNADGDLKVGDFGIAKVLGGGRTLATLEGSVLGTPAYMAPEQAEGTAVGPPTDVYALGTILYELLSGRLPFEADSPMALLVQRITADPPHLSTVAPTVPGPIADVVMRCLERDPSARFASAEELGCALGEAAVVSLGSEWLNTSGVSVSGSRAILLSATARVTSPAGSGSAGGAAVIGASDAAPTVAPVNGASHDAPPTVLPVTADRPAAAGEAPPTVLPRAATPTVAAVGAPAAADTLLAAGASGALATVVRPRTTSHAVGFDSSIRRSDLVGVDEVTRDIASEVAPVSRPAIVALVAFAIALVAGVLAPRAVGTATGPLRVNGVAPGPQPVEVDFGAPLVLSGLGTARSASAQLRLAGMPVGSVTAAVRNGTARLDLRNRDLLLHGPVVVRVTVTGPAGRQVAARPFSVMSRSEPWTSAQGPVSAVIALAALASAEASSGRHRKGRVRRDALVSGAVTGAIGTVALVLVWSMVRSQPAAAWVMGIAALASGVGFGALHVWRARLARRRRLRWRAGR